MRAIDLLDAFEALDAETVYEAHARTAPRRRISGRAAAAAAILLFTVSAILLYGIFLSPAATVYLDSRESVTITLNSRGRVLNAGGHDELSGRTAEEAVEAVTRDMLESGALDEDENTLILGASKLSGKAQANLSDTVQSVFAESRFHGAIVSLPCSESGGKAAVIKLLADTVDELSADSLKHLSANDLNLLLHEYRVIGSAVLTGEPSESGYIGREAAVKRARENSKLNDAEFSVTYLPYRGRLVYLVRIIDSDTAEAFFIDAASGAIEIALRTNPERLDAEIRTEVKNRPPIAETPTVRNAAADILPATNAPTEAPTLPVETAQPTIAPTDLPTDLPTVSPTVPTQVPTTEETESSTESPQEKSLTVIIPYNKLTELSETAREDVKGQSVRGIPIINSRDPINYPASFPASYVADIPISGRQDSILLLIRTYEDFVSLVNTDPDSGELGAYGASLQTDHHIDRDYFRENALIVLYYMYDKAYVNAHESDELGPIRVNGDTAYVRFTQTLFEEQGYYTSAMPYIFKTVAAVEVVKSEVENVSNLVLIPEVTVETVEYPRKQKINQRSE